MKFACRSLALAVGLLVMAPWQLQAGTLISAVTKAQGNATAVNLVDAGLVEGVEAYVDRTHILVNIPNAIEGADFIQVSNDDKTSNPYQLDVTISGSGLSLLYVGLDKRLLDGDNSTPADPLAWMSDAAAMGLPNGFIETGAEIDIDEGANGSVDQSFSLWVTLAPPGTYSLFEQDNGGSRNNYIVFASRILVVPEPSVLALAAVGLLGVLGATRRRRAA